MASTETEMSYSATLSYSTTSGGSYTVLGGVKNVKWDGKKPAADASALEDTTVVRMPKRTDLGTISGDGLFRKTQFAILFTAWTANTKYYWKLTSAGGSVLGPFYGNINDLSLDFADDEPVMSSFSIETSGVAGSSPTFTP